MVSCPDSKISICFSSQTCVLVVVPRSPCVGSDSLKVGGAVLNVHSGVVPPLLVDVVVKIGDQGRFDTLRDEV